MGTITLSHTTGDKDVDETIIAFIGSFEATFPGHIRAYYLEGSHANHTRVANSDLDLIIVCKKQTEYKHVQQVIDHCREISTRELDISIENEVDLTKGIVPMMKDSRFLYGEDILHQFPLISLKEWTHDRMHASYWLLVSVFHRPLAVRWPITYPDTQGEFYGYDNRKVLASDGTERNSTRNLVRVTGWMATARIALEAGKYVTHKHECYTMYPRWIGDEWTAFLNDTYTLCRGQWNYLVPDDPSERAHLKSICAKTLDWENHFLQVYKSFLITELQNGSNSVWEKIVRLLTEIPYYDQDIQATLQKMHATAAPHLQELIEKALQCFAEES